MNVSISLKFSVPCHLTWILPQQVKHIRKQFLLKKKSHLSLVKQLVLTSELLLGFKVEMNEAIPTSHKAILFHFPVELDRQPCIYLHLEVFFITVQS